MIRYTCPQCQQQVLVERREDLPTRPFCSARCQRTDLGKWLTGEYRISDPLPQAGIPGESSAEIDDSADN